MALTLEGKILGGRKWVVSVTEPGQPPRYIGYNVKRGGVCWVSTEEEAFEYPTFCDTDQAVAGIENTESLNASEIRVYAKPAVSNQTTETIMPLPDVVVSAPKVDNVVNIFGKRPDRG